MARRTKKLGQDKQVGVGGGEGLEVGRPLSRDLEGREQAMGQGVSGEKRNRQKEQPVQRLGGGTEKRHL